MGRRVFRSYYKGHMNKTKGEGGSKRGRWFWLGWGGRRIFRNYYKGHMEKTKEEVEAKEGGGFGWDEREWWGENADNCN